MPQTMILRRAAGAGLLLCLAAGPAPTHAAPLRDALPGILVHDAWVRILLPDVPPAAYFVLQNDTPDALTLTGADSPVCGRMTIHRTVTEGGVARMQMLDSVVVPPEGVARFAPGGEHLMCMHAAGVRPGEHIHVTLRFADGRTLSVPFAIEGLRRP